LNADLSLNTGFNSTGNVTLNPNSTTASVAYVTDLYVANGVNDSDQFIYLTGYTVNGLGNTSTMFAYRIANDGLGDPVAIEDSAVLTAGVSSAVAGCVRQSSNGRILVSGYAGGATAKGVIAAYTSDMSAVDTSFGNAQGSTPNYGVGYYTTATNGNIPAMTTDNSDRLYIAYMVDSTTINLDRVLENGTALDTTFNSGGGTPGRVTITGTGWAATKIKLAIDLVNSQIIVAALGSDPDNSNINVIRVNRYNFNGSAAGSQVTVSVSGQYLELSDLFIDNDTTSSAYPNIYVVGYNVTDSKSIVARIATTSTTMTLDTSYGGTGIANINNGAMTVVTAGALDPDRRVYMVGSNGSTTGYMARNYGDYYWNQASPAILQAVVGTPDLTLNPSGASGNKSGVDIATVTGWTTVAGFTAYAIVENPAADGTSFIAFGDGIDVYVGKVNADMSPATDFNTTGLSNGYTMPTINNMAFDSLGNILVSGTNSGASTTLMFSPAGALTATFATTLGSTVGTTVAQQKSGRYIVGGKIGSSGAVCAFQNASAVSGESLPIDPTFGPAATFGYYLTGVNSQIDDLVIDQNDYVYIVYRAEGTTTVNVAKLTPEGALVTTANTPSAQQWETNPITATGITATSPARIAINSANNILVGATTSSNVSTQLYNANTGATIGSLVAVTTAAGRVLTRLVGAGATSGSGAGTEFYGSVYTSTPSALAFAITNAGALDVNFGTGTVGAQSGVTSAITAQSVTSVNGISIQADGNWSWLVVTLLQRLCYCVLTVIRTLRNSNKLQTKQLLVHWIQHYGQQLVRLRWIRILQFQEQ